MRTAVSRHRSWSLKVFKLPFGINLAPEEFECKLNENSGLSSVAVIRDEILLMGYGENEEDANQIHDENLVRLLHKALKPNLRLSSSKMNLLNLRSEVRFMGHLITKDGSGSIQIKLRQCRKCERLIRISKCEFRKLGSAYNINFTVPLVDLLVCRACRAVVFASANRLPSIISASVPKAKMLSFYCRVLSCIHAKHFVLQLAIW